jgi:hypothetical protein
MIQKDNAACVVTPQNTEKKVVYNYNVCNDWKINPDIDKIKTIQSQPLNNENNK